jgi:membrane dipeptidase
MSDERVERIHRDGVIVDMVTNLLTEGVVRAIDDFRAGGVHLICQSIDPPWHLSAHARPYLDLTPDPHTALRTVAWVRRLVQEREDLAFVETMGDVHGAKAAGRLGVTLHSQNATPFGLDLDLVGDLYAAGLRMSGLAYNVRSLAADGCIEESNAGLSRFGRRLVLEMNRVGMIVDGSHVGVRSTLEAMDLAEAPFVFSHNGCGAVHEHPRNLTDEQLRRCAESGGVIGILAIPLFLAGGARRPSRPSCGICSAIEVAGSTRRPRPGPLVRHAAVRGPDLAPVDRRPAAASRSPRIFWDEPPWPAGRRRGEVEGLGTPAGVPLITAALMDRGLGEAEVVSIMGGNWLRVLAATWR